MLVEATEAMVSDVDKETIIKLVEVAKAECAEHDILRRQWRVRFAQEADQRWRQRYLRLRTTQLQPWLQQWMGQSAHKMDDEAMTATKVPTNWSQLLGDDRRLRSSLS